MILGTEVELTGTRVYIQASRWNCIQPVFCQSNLNTECNLTFVFHSANWRKLTENGDKQKRRDKIIRSFVHSFMFGY